jgi:hypothetical protein
MSEPIISKPSLYFTGLYTFTLIALINPTNVNDGSIFQIKGSIGHEMFCIRTGKLALNRNGIYIVSNISVTAGVNQYVMFRIDNSVDLYECYFAISTTTTQVSKEYGYKLHQFHS